MPWWEDTRSVCCGGSEHATRKAADGGEACRNAILSSRLLELNTSVSSVSVRCREGKQCEFMCYCSGLEKSRLRGRGEEVRPAYSNSLTVRRRREGEGDWRSDQPRALYCTPCSDRREGHLPSSVSNHSSQYLCHLPVLARNVRSLFAGNS